MKEKKGFVVVLVLFFVIVISAIIFLGIRSIDKGREPIRRAKAEAKAKLRAEAEVQRKIQRVQEEEQRKREERWLSQQTKPLNGMTETQVRRIWGKPIEKVYQPQTVEGWFYGSRYNDGDMVDKFVWFKYGKVYIVVTTAEALRGKRIDDRHVRIGDETLAAYARGDMYAWKRFQTLFINFSKNERIKEMSNGEFEKLLGRIISEEDPRITHMLEAAEREREAIKREREAVEFEREEFFRSLAARLEEERQEERQEKRFRQRRRSADVTNIMNQFRSSGMMPSGY